jgi:hypothetical protein
MMIRHSLPLPLLLLFVLLGSSPLACAFLEPYTLAPDAPKSGELRSLLLLPLNFDVAPSPQLVHGTEILEAKLIRFLSESGFDVHQIRLSAVTEDWRASQEEVGGLHSTRRGKLDEKSYEIARAAVVRRALARKPADAAIVPTLLVREARYYGRKLQWDGVSRDASIDMSGTTRALAYLKGKELATSLRVTVYDRSGRKVFERYAGLEPIVRYVTSQDHWRREQRADLFEDDRLLESGVRMAFEPWLVAPPLAAD